MDLGDVVSNSGEVSPDRGKRSAETVEDANSAQPPPKRLKRTVSESISDVCLALRHADLKVPWSASLFAYLLAASPSALQTPQDKRGDTEKTLFKLLNELFDADEPRIRACVAQSQTKLNQVMGKKSELDTAVERASADLEAKRAEMSTALKSLSGDIASVRKAEDNTRQALQQVLEKERETYVELRRDRLEPLRKAHWASEAEVKKQITLLKIICARTDAKCSMEALSSVMSKDPAERSDFDCKILDHLEEAFDKYISELEVDAKFVASVAADAPSALEENVTTLQDAQSIRDSIERQKEARVLMPSVDEIQDKFPKLKTSSEQVASDEHKSNLDAFGKHFATVASVLKWSASIDGGLELNLPETLASLNKHAEERSESDRTVVDNADKFLTERLATVKERLGENILVNEITHRRLEQIKRKLLSNSRASTKMIDDVRKPLAKDQEHVAAVRREQYEALSAGTLLAQKRGGAMRKLNTVLKKHEFESGMISAFQSAIQKLPAERSLFQQTVVKQVGDNLDALETSMKDQLEVCEANAAVAEVKEIELVHSAQSSVDAAERQRTSTIAAIMGNEDSCNRLDSKLQKQQQASEEHEAIQKQASADFAKEQEYLSALEQAREALGFLHDPSVS